MKQLLSFAAVLLLVFAIQAPGSAKAPVPRDTAAPPLTGKVHLVWQHADEPAVDFSRHDKVPGVNVVSPVWYTIDNDYGHVTDRSVPQYVERAHARGYQVWPLLTNGFDPDRTRALLNEEQAQRYVIDQLLEQAKKHRFDGINLDFEHIYEADRDKLTAFVARIRHKTKEAGLTLSMDVTVPDGSPDWSLCYDRKGLARHVDYLMLMAYDQYTRGSRVPGPTASYNWDADRVAATLQEVPARKLVLGLPLYMRLWRYDAAQDRWHASTLTMRRAEQLRAEKGILPSWQSEWLPNLQMFRCAYEEDGVRYQFWLENTASLYLKTRLVEQHGLAGTAAWRYGFETPEVWPMLQERLASAGQTGQPRPPTP